jgi:rhamnosyltransferase
MSIKINKDVTIAIPTFMGERYIEEVLNSVFCQKTSVKYEVLVIDSGSVDDTVNIVKKFDARIIEIPNSEFGHGKTRNMAIDLAHGDFVVFLTQDATPFNEYWLEELIKLFNVSSEIVATYSKHVPRPDCNLIVKRDIVRHFKKLSPYDQLRLDFLNEKEVPAHVWHQMIFFSNVSSAIKKKITSKIKFADVPFSEDQLFGKEVIRAGFKKAYIPTSIVFHSHDYRGLSYFRRMFDEFAGIETALGYIENRNIIHAFLKAIGIWLYSYADILSMEEKLGFVDKIIWFIKSLEYAFYREMAGYLAAKKSNIPKGLVPVLSYEANLKQKVEAQKRSLIV